VLKYRKTLEDLAKNEYRDAMHKVNLEQETLRHMKESQRQLMRFYDIKAGAVVQPEMLHLVGRYSVQLAQLIDMQKDIIIEKQKIAQEKLHHWNKKRQDMKVVEKLREKKWNEYLRESDKEDQKFQDEIHIAKKVRETLDAAQSTMNE
jgi:flagellar FliJ protein